MILLHLLAFLLVMPLIWLAGIFWFLWQLVSGESWRRDNGR